MMNVWFHVLMALWIGAYAAVEMPIVGPMIVALFMAFYYGRHDTHWHKVAAAHCALLLVSTIVIYRMDTSNPFWLFFIATILSLELWSFYFLVRGIARWVAGVKEDYLVE